MKSIRRFSETSPGVGRPLFALIVCASLGALVSVACTADDVDGTSGDKVLGGQTGDEFEKVMQRLEGDVERRPIEGPQVGEASASLSEFAWSFYKASSSTDENFVYSPYSLATAAAMLYAGVAGETQSQMSEVFQFGEETAAFHQARNDLMQYLSARNIEATEDRNAQVLKVSNDFWMAARLRPHQTFLDTLGEFYGAPAYLFEGTPEDVRLAINSKVASDTESLIDELLPGGSITTDTVFVLTNALYFKASWEWEFRKDGTEKAEFMADDGSVREVDMMHSVDFSYGYQSQAGVEVLSMPYFGRELEFVAMMPSAGSFSEFASTLDAAEVAELTQDLPSTALNLRFPKLEVDTEVPLKEELIDLGMTDAFSAGAANFEPMTSGNVFLGAAFHQTKLILDEKGTEAAAATAFVGVDESAPPEPVMVTFDRPFVFMIRDMETQAVLFVGHFAGPE